MRASEQGGKRGLVGLLLLPLLLTPQGRAARSDWRSRAANRLWPGLAVQASHFKLRSSHLRHTTPAVERATGLAVGRARRSNRHGDGGGGGEKGVFEGEGSI